MTTSADAPAAPFGPGDRPKKVKRRNVTLSLPEDLLRRARVLAAEQDRSLTSLVEQRLAELVREQVGSIRSWDDEIAVMREGLLSVGDAHWTRDELHERSA